jgi:hypothetical protein
MRELTAKYAHERVLVLGSACKEIAKEDLGR